jgi:hypothetical protein
MFEWDWNGVVSVEDVDDMNSTFGKTVVGITYLRNSKAMDDGPSESKGNDFENAAAVAMLCSKIEELSPGLISECIALGVKDLTERGIIARKH